MTTEHGVELLCRKTNALTFARLGFTMVTTAEPVNAPANIKMTRPGVDDAIVTSLVDLRLNGKRFIARIVGMNCDLAAQEVML